MSKQSSKAFAKPFRKASAFKRKNAKQMSIRDKKRKIRKEKPKKHQVGKTIQKSRQDIKMPKLHPMKNDIIKQLLNRKNKAENEKKIQALQAKKKFKLEDESLLGDLYKEKIEVEEERQYNNEGEHFKDTKKYLAMVKKVIEQADIILEVLDARDPLACRCKELEAQIQGMSGEKKLIFVLNKVDLVPLGNANQWQQYLRREFATVLFKSNLQNQQTHLSSSTLYSKSVSQRQDLAQELLDSSKAVGCEKLLELIKNYSKIDGNVQTVTVGVIGYPNVGKSSVINSLKRSKACMVSSVAGQTKGLQEIMIDSKVKIVDCPGVIFDSKNEKHTLLRNIVRVELIEDPIRPVQEILDKVDRNQLLLLYKIGEYNDVIEFLTGIAKSRGKIKKGGIVDLTSSARLVLQDWNEGKIKYYSIPPLGEGEIEME